MATRSDGHPATPSAQRSAAASPASDSPGGPSENPAGVAPLIEPDDLGRQAVRDLIAEHLADMHATSPAESVHALDHAGLRAAGVSFWTSWDGGTLLGCAALKQLSPTEGEIKAMRTRPAARGRGVAAHLLAFLIEESRRRGYHRLNLETGSEDFFAPARRLYARHGFVFCPPFADYVPDPNSVFMTRSLSASAPAPADC
ncbi:MULTISPECIES: GNAT family N-acetyltransferase [Actinoalloteichus]|uniref:Acetyltransferase (GNAT) family protein n=1 Tax=Actinoalloteichus fjordicus TaxID=1612552 RepID=A0AAC9LEZ9_9PSEU|nr:MULTISPECIES: GNAT family N-acetyltransferase [Actinoalloteichus]APU15100.1 acetyltransferase (GNAT) family protein [Actinoalloteichus fjordicus]APU21168.1 acetyltransferase (GNAT) family protein [Actinoalloteichus sp. GBA129-24]